MNSLLVVNGDKKDALGKGTWNFALQYLPYSGPAQDAPFTKVGLYGQMCSHVSCQRLESLLCFSHHSVMGETGFFVGIALLSKILEGSQNSNKTKSMGNHGFHP